MYKTRKRTQEWDRDNGGQAGCSSKAKQGKARRARVHDNGLQWLMKLE